jgi:nucleotide-binding universal stress UspA family protein
VREIIAGVDATPYGFRVAEWAAAEAAYRGAALRIVHALPSWLFEAEVEPRVREIRDWMLAGGQKIIDEAVAKANARLPEVAVAAELVPGGPARALIEAAKDGVMIVVGCHGASTLAGLVLGSVALQVVTHAPCPAVVVGRAEAPARREVVVGIDGSAHDQVVIEFACAEASFRSARLRAVYAWTHLAARDRPPAADRDAAAEEAGRMLAERLAGWQERFPELEIVRDLRHERPVTALTAAATGCQLLVVGSRGRGGFDGLRLGSVSHAMLHRARCPVAVVPSPGG